MKKTLIFFKKSIDNPGAMCYNKANLERGENTMVYNFYEVHGAEWEELQALLQEEE